MKSFTRIRDFSCESSLKVFCGTWNVNTRKLLSEEDDQISSNLDEWLCQSEFSNSCDIYAIGFQEIIDLSTVNVVITTQKSIERAGYWKTKIVETLSKFPGQNFSLVAEKSLVGLLVFVFCRDSLVSHIRDVRTASLPTGVLGIMGNKGSTCISFDVHLTSFCFVCTHFHADRDAVLIRNADFHNILENTELIRNKNSIARKDDVSFRSKWWYDEGSNISKIMDHDHVFWFGDLNYRINGSVPMDVVFAKVVVDDWRSLREVDQLNEERLRGAVFAEFHEGDIAFAPTYKFQPGSSQYEQRSDKKLRAPAWCDRILWKVAKESEKSKSNSRSWVKQLSYRSVPMKSSDHRPVLASFECSIAEGIHEKERAVYQDLLNVLDKWENAIAPRIEVPVRFLDFGEVRYMTSVSQTLEIRNIGGVIAKWNFVPKMDEASVSKSCIRFAPISGVMSPGEVSIDIVGLLFLCLSILCFFCLCVFVYVCLGT